jgi:hypothetical protein
VAASDWALVGLGVVAVGVALWAGPNLAVAEPAAAAAIALVALEVALALRPRLRRSGPWLDPAVFAPPDLPGLVIEEGAMGRQTIIATISGLEAEVFGAQRRGLSLDEEMQLARAPPRQFREWVDRHLTDLEQAT